MTSDLFSAGFAWDDAAVSQPDATGDATPRSAASAPCERDHSAVAGSPVAGVAGVAEKVGQRLERELSQPLVAARATPPATAETADFRGFEPAPHKPVADVATVAGWSEGVASLVAGRVPVGVAPGQWADLVRDALQLMRLWGGDLHKAGWSVCDVFGVEPKMVHRRLDRLGLVAFINGGDVEAIDANTATTRHGKDRLTYDRRLRSAGSVPLWTVAEGEMK